MIIISIEAQGVGFGVQNADSMAYDTREPVVEQKLGPKEIVTLLAQNILFLFCF